MKKIILYILSIFFGSVLLASGFAQAGTVLFPIGGGTGTSTAPTNGQILVGNSGGTYSPTLISSPNSTLTITGAKLDLNLNHTNLWNTGQNFEGGIAMDGQDISLDTLNADIRGSGTGVVFINGGAETMNQAGDITGGKMFANQFIPYNSTNLSQGFLSYSGVAGAAVTSSTSPTVNYLTATSTTQASAFYGDVNVNGKVLVTNGNSINTQIKINNSGSGTALLDLKSLNGEGAMDITNSGGVQISSFQTGDIQFIVGNGNTQQLELSNAGNLGIGSTSPWAQLSVSATGGGTQPLFTIASSTNGLATSTAFMVDKNGNVGINTVNPAPAASRSGIVVRGKGGDGTSEIIAQSTSVTDGTNGGNVLLSSGNDGYIYNRQSGNEYIGTNNAQQITILGSNGFVGVNKSVPAAQLDVSGTVETEGSVGGLQFDSRTGSGSNFQWYDPAGADARLYNSSTGDVITVLQNGHTGILCSPNSGVTFDVCDSSNTTESQIYNTSSSKAALLDVFNSSGPEMQAWAIGTTYPGGSYFGHGYASTLDLISVSGTMQIGTFDANSLVLGTNNTAAVTLDSSQALTYRKDQNTNTQFTIQNANAPGAALMHFVNDTSTFDFGYGGSTNAAVPNQGYFFGSTGVSLSWWSNATKQMTLDTSGNLGIQTASPGSTLDVNGTITTKELVGGGNAPTATLGAGAGTSPTMTIIGSDLTGTIYLTTGTGPSNGVSNVFTMTFLNATTNTRTCSILNGVNHAAWANQNLLMASSTKTTLVVTNESTISALPASTLLIFTYFCPVQ